MSEGDAVRAEALTAILRDLEEAQQRFMMMVTQVTDAEFAWQPPDGDSIKRTLERAADEVNFGYGRLVARMLELASTACIPTAEFLSSREASVALQVAYRRFVNLLHDLRPQDLDRTVEDGPRTANLRGALATAAQHYRRQAKQVERLRAAWEEAQG
ncbi:MAG: DinB family protein [Dehalococcoidia bacterium]